MKYSELSDTAKKIVREDYQRGWLETHTDIFTDVELDELCRDTDDEVEYQESGVVK